uniref:Large ribosomal subunit protein mL50 n=1 Tax=Schistosoma haematobium TaxID=6185 RepID=A0A095AMS7_SCHHA
MLGRQIRKYLQIPILSNSLSTNQFNESKVYNFTSRLQSLADKSKNILMNRDPYCPPEDVELRIEALNCVYMLLYFLKQIFTACITEFNHHIANSYLHEINSIEDLISYFMTPVETPDFLYKLTSDARNNVCQLPPNLNIQLEPVRYNPNEDHFFKVNAYPGRSTILLEDLQ